MKVVGADVHARMPAAMYAKTVTDRRLALVGARIQVLMRGGFMNRPGSAAVKFITVVRGSAAAQQDLREGVPDVATPTPAADIVAVDPDLTPTPQLQPVQRQVQMDDHPELEVKNESADREPVKAGAATKKGSKPPTQADVKRPRRDDSA